MVTRLPDEVGPNHRTWNLAAAEAGLPAPGSVTGRTNLAGVWGTPDKHQVVEMATGMHYWNGGAWVPSDPSFDSVPAGFSTSRLQYQVSLSLDICNPAGAVSVMTRDGIQLKSTPAAICLFDSASGNSLVIATITNSVGVLASNNVVIYPNAFKGNGVAADVIFQTQRGSFAQDVVFRTRLNPADYGFPTNTTRIQVVTEFFGAPDPDRVVHPISVEQDPSVRNAMASPDIIDEALGFGEFVLGTGRAGLAPLGPTSPGPAAPVAKQFTVVSGRQFLIESVDYASVRGELSTLPPVGPHSVQRRRYKTAREAYASLPTSAARYSKTVASAGERPLLVSARLSSPGVAFDYVATIGGTLSGTTVLEGDCTYFVSGPVYCNGPTTIEGGVIFKYPNSTGANPTTAYIKLTSTVTCLATPYREAVCTAGDDDTIGDSLEGIWSNYTGTPSKFYANPAIWISYLSSASLSNIRFCYAEEGFRFEAGRSDTATLSDSQFVNCIRGIVITGSGSGSGSGSSPLLTVNNALLGFVLQAVTVKNGA